VLFGLTDAGIAAAAPGGRANGPMSSKRLPVGSRPSTAATIKYFMTGNNQKGIILQDRDQHLLRELALMRVIDREQAMCVAGFGSTTRANSRLLGLTRAGLLWRFFLGTKAGGKKALYALSPTGAKLVDVPFRGPRRVHNEVLIADFFVTHQLCINQIYYALKSPQAQ
jgi:hypothetical protein